MWRLWLDLFLGEFSGLGWGPSSFYNKLGMTVVADGARVED